MHGWHWLIVTIENLLLKPMKILIFHHIVLLLANNYEDPSLTYVLDWLEDYMILKINFNEKI